MSNPVDRNKALALVQSIGALNLGAVKVQSLLSRKALDSYNEVRLTQQERADAIAELDKVANGLAVFSKLFSAGLSKEEAALAAGRAPSGASPRVNVTDIRQHAHPAGPDAPAQTTQPYVTTNNAGLREPVLKPVEYSLGLLAGQNGIFDRMCANDYLPGLYPTFDGPKIRLVAAKDNMGIYVSSALNKSDTSSWPVGYYGVTGDRPRELLIRSLEGENMEMVLHRRNAADVPEDEFVTMLYLRGAAGEWIPITALGNTMMNRVANAFVMTVNQLRLLR